MKHLTNEERYTIYVIIKNKVMKTKSFILILFLLLLVFLITYQLVKIQKRILYFNSDRYKIEILKLYHSVGDYYFKYRELPKTKKDFKKALEIEDVNPENFQLLKYGISFYLDTADQYISYYCFGVNAKDNHMIKYINGNNDSICKNLVAYFRRYVFDKEKLDYRLFGYRILSPCEFGTDYFFSKEINSFDRKNIISLIDELTNKFIYNYFKLDNYDTLIYTNDYILNYIMYEKENNKYSFKLLCSEYFEWKEGAIPDYFSEENNEFIDSLFQFYRKNYDTFKITGQLKIIFTVRYQIEWMKKLKDKQLVIE